MKLDTVKNYTESNVETNNAFSIKANSHAFRILSDGMYSDKILAIVRELSTNAIDSHVASNNMVPFEIKLPTGLDPSFHIKDFGTGLSKNDILGYTDANGLYHSGIYNTYFESTKQDSNDFIGALGLGSKTPFNYVSSFYVVSIYGNVESTYVCYLNDEYVPTVSFLSETETNEHSGLTIKFNVEPKDFQKFKSSAESVYVYLNLKPTIIGDSIHYYNPKYIDKGFWKIRTSYRTGSGCQIIQGGISYPINYDIIYQKMNSEKSVILNNNIDIFVNIGDVDVAASREQLSYTKKTIDFLCGIINRIYDEYHIEIDYLIDAASSVSDLCNIQYVLNIYSSSFVMRESIRNKVKVLLDGNTNIHLRPENNDIISFSYPNFNINVYSKSYGKWSKETRNMNDMNLFNSENSLLVVNKHKLFKSEILELCSHYEHISKRIYVIDFLSKDDHSNVEDVFDCFSMVVYSLPAKRKKTVSCGKPVDNIAYTWSGYRSYQRKYSSYCWNSNVVDFELGGVYVDIKNFAVYNNEMMIDDFSAIISSCKSLDIHRGTVHGIQEKDKSKLNDKWINLFDLINQKCNITDDVVKYKIYECLSNEFAIDKLPFDKYNFHGKIKQCSDFIKDTVQYKNKKNEYLLYVQMNGHSVYHKHKSELDNLIEEIKESYPMLKYVKLSRWHYSEEYINDMLNTFHNYTKG